MSQTQTNHQVSLNYKQSKVKWHQYGVPKPNKSYISNISVLTIVISSFVMHIFISYINIVFVCSPFLLFLLLTMYVVCLIEQNVYIVFYIPYTFC